jgi:hypothetical protein
MSNTSILTGITDLYEACKPDEVGYIQFELLQEGMKHHVTTLIPRASEKTTRSREWRVAASVTTSKRW